MRWPGVDGSKIDFAFEYNVGRTWQTRSGGTPSSLTARVLAGIQGAFIGAGDRRCVPLQGRHVVGCVHSWGVVPIKVGCLADAIFAQSGGSQLRQVRLTIERAATTSVAVRRFQTGKPPIPTFGPLVSIEEWTVRLADEYFARGGFIEPDLAVRLAPDLLDGLLNGRYQRIPARLVQGLAGTGCDFLIWLALLCQQQTGQLKRNGSSAQFVLSGRKPEIERWQLGLTSASPLELEAALQRAARRGNDLQSDFHLDLVSRPDGSSRGLVVSVERRSAQGSGRQITGK
jgi:hypothetical protein